ncbi:EAL domain-containing protein [Azoarcus indigens]|nr:EAL domain-containing protein [Azoarcus indigens]
MTTLGLGREELVGRLAGERLGLEWPAADAPPLARLRPQAGDEELTARVLAGPQAGWRLLVLPPLGQAIPTLPAPAPEPSPATPQGSAVHVPLDVFDAASQAILVSDANNRIVAVNRAFTDITGYSREDVLGRNPGLLNSGRQEPEFYAALWQSLHETGQWQGEIWNRRKNGEIFPEWLTITAVRDDEGATRHYIAMFTDLTAKRQAESRTEYLAHHDILTGLPNRRLFERRFDDAAERARQRRCSVGVMRLDIDNFKAVNREYGDNVGDAFLQQIARRLLAALPRGCIVARERSDAFLALLPDLDLSSECGRAAEALLATLSLPFEAEGHNLQLTASIGIALLPEDGNTLDALLRHADAALAHARRLGGNNHQYYVLEMDDAGIEREAFESKLRYAIEREELEVHFQPLIDARDGSIRAGEALLRWHHPELGLIPFRRFIGAARDGGLVARLGDWALRAACRAAVGWPLEGGRQPMVTVNVAIEQIMQGDFVSRVATALADSGLPADRLELDLDEQVLQEDNSRIVATLTELAGMGIHLAIDDFGRGLTAIPKLKRYPLQALKLDPALVRDVGKSEESEAIVEAIANLATSLGLAIFARGVEDEAQQAFLSALDCHLQQGPLFGRPLTDAEFAAFLARRQLENGLQ